jgi:S1-C subfamily serine protease
MLKWLVALSALGLLFLFPGLDQGQERVDLAAKKRAVVYISVSGVQRVELFGKSRKYKYRKKSRKTKPPAVEIPWGSLGTGWLVTDDGYIVTAAHVIGCPEDVEDCKVTVEVWGFPGLVIEPATVYENLTFDIAVLKIKGEHFRHFKLAEKEPELGEEVWAMGHPRGLKWSVFKTAISNKGFSEFGKVGDINGDQVSHWLYQLEKPIPRGISGGVVFNTKGEAVCMPHASYVDDITATNFCVPSTEIDRVLRFLGVK